eukprot:CAMPEP_0179415280 /NCGR_PEP_ID=MMETSP0799-20121207/6145_1 /TAXON_ID=46947 /ORGANISM="Geminigera cryophila, Strain CCMP2564" /LENGTH=278 /DNA_ID=CAMNT_0021188003 /DNA_START=28 /DNA_END=864 /DNA_ORIENTATION=-
MTTAVVLAALLAVFQPASAFISTVPCVRPRTAPACMASSSSSSSDGDKTRVRLPIGRISSLDRSKIATDEDSQFYAAPRLVTHADDKWIGQLTALYRERIPPNAVVLDIMGSHVSHLPVDVAYSRVDVHGLNEAELLQNPVVKSTGGACFKHDFNGDPALPFVEQDSCYDAVLCCLGVQYLEEPEMVFAEVGRVLKTSGTVIVSFSSNLFYEKALSGWIDRGMKGRSRLVKDYLRAAGGFEDIEELGSGVMGTMMSLLPGNAAGDPFGAVVARRSRVD